MTKRSIMVLGRSGQLGQTLHALGDDQLVFLSRAQCDVTDSSALAHAFSDHDWAAVINATAYTDVDGAESYAAEAYAVNAKAPADMARLAAERGILLAHVSTDYVFAGNKTTPYDESDSINPLGVYGATKAAGEAAIRASGARHAILRTAWLQGQFGGNFIDTMNRLAEERDELRVIADRFGNPTSVQDFAETLLLVTRAIMEAPMRPGGTWHFVNSGKASWYDLAALVMQARAEAGLPVPRLVPVPASEWPCAAPRPPNSQLSTVRITQDFAVKPRDWQGAISALLPHILETPAGQDS